MRRTTTPGSGAPARNDNRASRDELVSSIASMVPAMRRLFEVRPRGEARAAWGALTAHQLEALAELKRGGMTMGALCERLDISESAGSALCDRLVARQMVVREADEDDRRVVRVRLSDEARATAERFGALKRRRIAEVLAVLGDEDLAALERIHRRLLASGQEDAGDPPRPSGEAVRP